MYGERAGMKIEYLPSDWMVFGMGGNGYSISGKNENWNELLSCKCAGMGRNWNGRGWER